MIRPFARPQNARASSEPATGSAPPRAADRPVRPVRRRARPEVEMLGPRLLMASGSVATVDATASAGLADRVAQALQPSSPSIPIISAVGIRAASPPRRWPSRCTRRPRMGPLHEGDSGRRRGDHIGQQELSLYISRKAYGS